MRQRRIVGSGVRGVGLGCSAALVLASIVACSSEGAEGPGSTMLGGPSEPSPSSTNTPGGMTSPGATTPPGNTEVPNELDMVGTVPTAPPAGTGNPVPSVPGEPQGNGFNQMEDLDRGVVAVVRNGGAYVGWRMFGYEYNRDNPERITYNLYRDGQLVANVPGSTNFQDPAGTPTSVYSVAPVIDGVEGVRSGAAVPWADNFLRIPLERPSANHSPSDLSAGDLDGDGAYDYVVKWEPANARDNSQAGVTDNVFLDGVKLDGTRLWRIDLGPNIRAGAHYTQFVVADADGDGRAEMMVKTAPGTRDSAGFLSLGPAATDNDATIFRNADGYVLTGPEYVTVFDGATGKELATANYDQARGNVNDWGDGYGNRVDRFLATAARLDDSGLQSFVMTRGYYERTTLTAWNWRGGQLTQLWKFDSNQTPEDARGNPFTHQGAHSLSVANVDADPEQEIIFGAMSVDNDGKGMCSTNFEHGDALHVDDFMPDRPGLEVYMVAESTDKPQWHFRDGATCAVIRASDATGQDVGRGVAADLLPNSPGAEFWAGAGNALRSAATGALIGGAQPNSVNFLIWWDADESRELENGSAINKLGVQQALLNCAQCSSNNGTKSTPGLVADVLGDWREEIIWRETNNTALRIYTTTDVTTRRIYTLMHDPQYRAAISWQNAAYNQPPHPGFHIGGGMVAPPTPDIRVLPRPVQVR